MKLQLSGRKIGILGSVGSGVRTSGTQTGRRYEDRVGSDGSEVGCPGSFLLRSLRVVVSI